jgi:DNA invertase Pin-like site-specific DNA recombinase
MPGPDMRGMRILLAARLSQKGDGQTGLETQDIVFRQWAEAQGATIVHVAEDRKSGTSAPWERKNLRPWVIEPHLMRLYDAVGAFKLDRLSRGDDETITRIEGWARENHKWLITAENLYYPCEGADSIRWDLMKRLAHQEWLGYSEKYRRMHKYLRDNGFFAHGNIPNGYRLAIVSGTEHKTLEPDPVTAPFIVEAVDRYLGGDSFRAVCAWLDSAGTKPRGADRWYPRTLQRLFRRSILTGRLTDSKGRTTLRFEPLISAEKWQALQATMGGRARGGRGIRDAALLSGIAVCATCERNMAYHISRRRRNDGSEYRVDYYRCYGSDRDRSTCRNMVRADELEMSVDWHLTEGEEHAAMELVEVATIPGDGRHEEIAEIDRGIRELDLDDPDYRPKHDALLGERARLKALPAKPDQVMERKTGLTVAEYWSKLHATGRRAFLLASKARVLASKGVALIKTESGWKLPASFVTSEGLSEFWPADS